MKKSAALFLVLLLCLPMMAQNHLIVHMKDGSTHKHYLKNTVVYLSKYGIDDEIFDDYQTQCIEEKGKTYKYPLPDVEKITFHTTEQLDEPEYVDLGLPSGTLWATCNVGATTPEEEGWYLAWGEQKPKDVYSWNSYFDDPYERGSGQKYREHVCLEKDDDVAKLMWGDKWHTPTALDAAELRHHATWTYERLNGMEGCRVTGPNGNSIFLPLAGGIFTSPYTPSQHRTNGYYWTSTNSDGVNAYSMDFSQGWISQDDNTSMRYCGQQIRPVRDPDDKVRITDIQIEGPTTMLEGEEAYLTASIIPSDATTQDFTWSTNNTEIINITPAGRIYAKKPGQVKVYASANDGSGTRTQLTIDIAPNPRPEIGQHEYVDLGLSVKWATCNVGASSPEESGDLFAFGETIPRGSEEERPYKYRDNNGITKYCTDSSAGIVDNIHHLEAMDDAACVNWGGEWRTPTATELYELLDKCTFTLIVEGNRRGYEVTGPNGNKIFLPIGIRKLGGNYFYFSMYMFDTNYYMNGETMCYFTLMLHESYARGMATVESTSNVRPVRP